MTPEMRKASEKRVEGLKQTVKSDMNAKPEDSRAVIVRELKERAKQQTSYFDKEKYGAKGISKNLDLNKEKDKYKYGFEAK